MIDWAPVCTCVNIYLCICIFVFVYLYICICVFVSLCSSSESRLCDWLVFPLPGRPLKFGQKNSQTFCREFNFNADFAKHGLCPFNLGGGSVDIAHPPSYLYLFGILCKKWEKQPKNFKDWKLIVVSNRSMLPQCHHKDGGSLEARLSLIKP